MLAVIGPGRSSVPSMRSRPHHSRGPRSYRPSASTSKIRDIPGTIGRPSYLSETNGNPSSLQRTASRRLPWCVTSTAKVLTSSRESSPMSTKGPGKRSSFPSAVRPVLTLKSLDCALGRQCSSTSRSNCVNASDGTTPPAARLGRRVSVRLGKLAAERGPR